MADYGDTPAFTVRELTGDKREVVLTGRALPYRPASFKTNQRVEVTWLPGSPEGSATVLGPTEDPSTFNGQWKEKYVQSFGVAAQGTAPPIELDGGAISGVIDAIELFDSICRYGQLLEVTWLDQVRRGFLTTFEKQYMTAKDVMWSMTFKWISRGEDMGPVVFTTVAGLGDLAAEVSSLLDALDEIETPEGFGIDFGFLDTLQDFQHSLEDAINSVTDAVTQFTNKVTSVTRTVRGIAATFAGLEEDAEFLAGYVESQFGEEAKSYARMFGPAAEPTGGLVSGTSYASQDESQKLLARLFQLELKQWLKDVQYAASARRASLQQALGGEVQATVTIRDGQSLQDIAAEYLGSPFEWQQLLVFNDLPSLDVAVGDVIYVPSSSPENSGTWGV